MERYSVTDHRLKHIELNTSYAESMVKDYPHYIDISAALKLIRELLEEFKQLRNHV
jgi:hypothetical protein